MIAQLNKNKWFILSLTILILALIITPIQSKTHPTNMRTKLEILLTIKWGQELGQTPINLVDPIPTGILSPFPVRKIRQPLDIYVSPSGQVSLLSYTSKKLALIDSFSSTGQYIGRVTISPENNLTEKISNFVTMQDGSAYTLDSADSAQFQNNSHQTYQIKYTKIATNRSEKIWQNDFDKKTPPQLLIDGNFQAFVALPHADKFKIHKLTPQGLGELSAEWGISGENLFINDKGVLFQTQMQWQTNPPQRDWVSYDPNTKKISHIIGNNEIYGFLGNVIGVDHQGQAYSQDLQDPSSICKVIKSGQLVCTEKINNIVTLTKKGKVFISSNYSVNDHLSKVHIKIFSQQGEYLGSKEININPTPQDGGGIWNLIHVSDEGNFYIFGGNDSLHQGRLLIYSSVGNLIQEQNLPSDILSIQSSLQSNWSIDSQGYIYLTVLEPDAVRVVRFLPSF
jgi:hypothetical protein